MKKSTLIFVLIIFLLSVFFCFYQASVHVFHARQKGKIAFAGEHLHCYSTGNFATSAQSAVVMEQSSGRVLFGKNQHAQLPMASTTKIVTALTVLQNVNIDQVVTIPKQACGVEGSSIYLREGEHLTVLELLYGLMLRSGNDCAVALALHVGGTLENFAQMMNDVARDIGCTNSNFCNPHGLHVENHYTSACDLAKITCKALQNETFQKIVSTKSVKISNEGYDYPRVLLNKNKLLSMLDGADGVKTGYTKKAGRCFVGSATKNGMQVVAVVLNCGPMFEETKSMLNEAFSQYTLQCAIPKDKPCGFVERSGGRQYYYCPQSFCYPVKVGESLTKRILLDGNARVEIFLNDKLLSTLPLESR